VDEQLVRSKLAQENERAVLHAAAVLNPSSSEESVRRYWREIAEAELALAGVDLDDDDPVTNFSPYWERESSQ
jgi:hypothetical protein